MCVRSNIQPCVCRICLLALPTACVCLCLCPCLCLCLFRCRCRCRCQWAWAWASVCNVTDVCQDIVSDVYPVVSTAAYHTPLCTDGWWQMLGHVCVCVCVCVCVLMLIAPDVHAAAVIRFDIHL